MPIGSFEGKTVGGLLDYMDLVRRVLGEMAANELLKKEDFQEAEEFLFVYNDLICAENGYFADPEVVNSQALPAVSALSEPYKVLKERCQKFEKKYNIELDYKLYLTDSAISDFERVLQKLTFVPKRKKNDYFNQKVTIREFEILFDFMRIGGLKCDGLKPREV